MAKIMDWIRINRMTTMVICSLFITIPICLSALAPRSKIKTINYRLTLQVEADGIVHTGTGVIETIWRIDGDTPLYIPAHGEAIPVDLGDRGILFVLLRGDETRKGSPPDPQHLLLIPFGGANIIGWGDGAWAGKITNQFLDTVAQRKDVAEIAPSNLPMMVKFRDLGNPFTIETVDPSDLSSAFGPGVKLLHTTLAITDAPPTLGTIEKKLTWLPGLLSKVHYSGYFRTSGPLSTLGVPAFEMSDDVVSRSRQARGLKK